MTTNNFCFYFQNRLIQTSQTGGQWYSDTSPFSIPWFKFQIRKNISDELPDGPHMHGDGDGSGDSGREEKEEGPGGDGGTSFDDVRRIIQGSML